MAGFVECLDNDEAEEGTETGDGEEHVPHLSFKLCTMSCLRSQPAILILQKLSVCIIALLTELPQTFNFQTQTQIHKRRWQESDMKPRFIS